MRVIRVADLWTYIGDTVGTGDGKVSQREDSPVETSPRDWIRGCESRRHNFGTDLLQLHCNCKARQNRRWVLIDVHHVVRDGGDHDSDATLRGTANSIFGVV